VFVDDERLLILLVALVAPSYCRCPHVMWRHRRDIENQ
jgi:hypothetical protein